MIYYVLKNKAGHYLSKDTDFEKDSTPRTTRHLTDASLFLHPNFWIEGFKIFKLEIKEIPCRTGYGN